MNRSLVAINSSGNGAELREMLVASFQDRNTSLQDYERKLLTTELLVNLG